MESPRLRRSEAMRSRIGEFSSLVGADIPERGAQLVEEGLGLVDLGYRRVGDAGGRGARFVGGQRRPPLS